jgi:hypothetical protein
VNESILATIYILLLNYWFCFKILKYNITSVEFYALKCIF